MFWSCEEEKRRQCCEDSLEMEAKGHRLLGRPKKACRNRIMQDMEKLNFLRGFGSGQIDE